MTTQQFGRYNLGFLWMICLVAAMGGLLFGYDWVVIGGAKPFYEPYFGISGNAFYQGFAINSALVGCLFGAAIAGTLSDRFGRKRLLILAGLLFTLSAIGTALAGDFITFNVVRWIGGLGIGLASNLSPMYIAEVSPATVRGKFVSIQQLAIVIGILAAQIINWQIAQPVPQADQLRLLVSTDKQIEAAYGKEFAIDSEKQAARELADATALEAVVQAFPHLTVISTAVDSDRLDQHDASQQHKEIEDREIMDTYLLATWNGQRGWRWMFAAEIIFAAAFFLFMFFVPESPRWLVKYGRDAEATAILARVGGKAYAESAVLDVKNTLAGEEIARVRFADLLEPKLRKVIALGVFLAVFQQWCGINVIFNYAQEVFSKAGYGVSDIMLNIVITGVVNLVFTLVAINTVDRLGRRVLMLIGFGGLAVIYAILGAGFYRQSTGPFMLVLVVSAIACYAMSLAPVTWVLISEIFPNRIRGAAMSVAVCSLWVACIILVATFPYLNRYFDASGTFWLYGLVCVIGFFVVLFKLPETKGKSLEQIERELVD